MYQGEIGIFLATAILGSAIVASKAVLNSGASAELYTFLRFAIAFTILAIVYARRLLRLKKEVWLAGLWAGIATALGFILQTVGLEMTSVAKVGFLSAMYVVIVPLIEGIVLHKPIQISDLCGIALAVVGLGLMSLNADLKINLGDIFALSSAVFLSIGLILISKYAAVYDPIALSTINIGVSAIVGGAFLLLSGRAGTIECLIYSKSTLIVLLYAAVIGTAAAIILQTWAQGKISATKAAIVLVLEPVFGAILAYVFLHELLSLRESLGAGIMLLGMLVSVLFNKK